MSNMSAISKVVSVELLFPLALRESSSFGSVAISRELLDLTIKT